MIQFSKRDKPRAETPGRYLGHKRRDDDRFSIFYLDTAVIKEEDLETGLILQDKGTEEEKILDKEDVQTKEEVMTLMIVEIEIVKERDHMKEEIGITIEEGVETLQKKEMREEEGADQVNTDVDDLYTIVKIGTATQLLQISINQLQQIIISTLFNYQYLFNYQKSIIS